MKKIFSVMTLLLFFGSAHYVSAAGSTSSVLTPCTGYSTTHFIPLDWGAAAGNVSVYTKDYGGFTNNEAVVVYFTTPSIPQTSTTIGGHIDGLQYIDLAVSARTSKLSAQPCDWSGAFSSSDTVGAAFSVGVPVSKTAAGLTYTYPELQTNTTYYFNINNRDASGNDTCGVGQSCNMIIQLYKPPGLAGVPAGVPTSIINTSPSPSAGGVCPGTFPASMSSNPPFGLVGVQWHQDFRFPNPFGDNALMPSSVCGGSGSTSCASTPLAKEELNFNWLMQNYGSEYAFNYMVTARNPDMGNQFRNAFDNGGAESARIINTYMAGGGNYGPTGTVGYNGSAQSFDGGTFDYGWSNPQNPAARIQIVLPFPTGVLTSIPGLPPASPTPAITPSCTTSITAPAAPAGSSSSSSLPTGPSARSQLYAGDTSGTPPTVQTSVQALGNGTFVPLTDIPGLTQGAVANSSGLAAFLNNLYKYLIGVAAILAVIEIVWGGLEISTKDSVSKQSDGKERITQAILGLILVLSPVLVFSIINPSILNLSVNLKPINLTTPAWGGGTIVAPVSSGNLLAPNGTLMACPNNDCLAADTACRQQGVNGAVVTPSVVCMIGGNIDTQGVASLGPDSSCPSGETKWIQCVTTPIVVPMP